MQPQSSSGSPCSLVGQSRGRLWGEARSWPSSFLLLVLWLVSFTHPTFAQTQKIALHCDQSALSNPDSVVHDCSALIEQGQLSGSRLAHTFNIRGMAHQSLGSYSLAILDYDEAIRLHPEYPEAFNNRGVAYQSRNLYAKAIEDYSEAIRLNPQDSITFRSRGIAHFCLGQYVEAQKDLKRAVQLKREDSFSIIWLYLAYARAGREEEIDLPRLTAGLSLKEWPGNAVRLFLSATRAETFLSASQAADGDKDRVRQCEARFFLGEYELLNRDRTRAIRLLQSAVDTGETSDFEYAAALSELERLKTTK
jgi:lipoprotein NlpI